MCILQGGRRVNLSNFYVCSLMSKDGIFSRWVQLIAKRMGAGGGHAFFKL